MILSQAREECVSPIYLTACSVCFKAYSFIFYMAAPSPFDSVEFPSFSSLPFREGDPKGMALLTLSAETKYIPIQRCNMGIL
jgi:hypothetical protein